MKTLWSVTVGVLFSFGFAGQLIAAPQFGRDRGPGQGQDRVCVYKDIHYQGVEQCFNAGDTVSTLQSLNGQVSSIRIYGRARVTVYDATNFRGHTTMFTSSMPDLGQVRLDTKSWSDRIQSLQVSSGNASNGPYGNAPVYRGPERGPFSNQQISEGVCVYERPNYQGRSQCWNAGEQLNDLARSGSWNDRISSIRVFGRTTAVAYRDIGFGGASFVVNRDIPDLAQVSASGVRNWDHQISSLKIENGRENGLPGRGRGGDRERGRFQD
jgi:hypothetical protein